MLCTQFYCNAPTHQESVWIHIPVVSRSHFVITPSQSKSICPPLFTWWKIIYTLRICIHFIPNIYFIFLITKYCSPTFIHIRHYKLKLQRHYIKFLVCMMHDHMSITTYQIRKYQPQIFLKYVFRRTRMIVKMIYYQEVNNPEYTLTLRRFSERQS
jgi:hypothetical protein